MIYRIYRFIIIVRYTLLNKATSCRHRYSSCGHNMFLEIFSFIFMFLNLYSKNTLGAF